MNQSSNVNWLLFSFDKLIRYIKEELNTSIQYIAWDLDGTLGEQPGWDGSGNIKDYIIDYPQLKEAMSFLSRQYGICHILVSRNGMFCDDTYQRMKQQLLKLGFHGVLQCYRVKKHSKVREFYMADGKPPNDVLLIDDQERECVQAQREGAFALHIETYVQDALPNNQFTLYVPDLEI